ncbi:MAG: MurR/RpiR family transcriptional regulator [Ilumatobacteraceae bacterium]
MSVADRIRERSDQLTPAERRIAAVVLAKPQVIGFGTVADLADASGAGAATVVRLANKLGYDGFVGLQGAVQRDLSGQLRPAAERIREQRAGAGLDDVRVHAEVERANVASTLDHIDTASTRVVIERLSDQRHPVLVLSGAASRGVATQFVIDLAQLRPGVSLLEGNTVDVMRTLALAADPPTIVAIDIRRYDRWVVDTLRIARGGGAWVVALTDSVLSPLASMADHAFVVSAESPGPFDSHVGTLALLDVLVVAVAAYDRPRATERLDRLEAAWRASDALTDQ